MVEREIQLLLSKIMRLTYRLIFLSTRSGERTVLLVADLGDEHEVVRDHVARVSRAVRRWLSGRSRLLFLPGCLRVCWRLLDDEGFLGFFWFGELLVCEFVLVSREYFGSVGALGVGDGEEAVVGSELFDVFVFERVDSAVWVRGGYRGSTGSR